jgi:hypothetical protein
MMWSKIRSELKELLVPELRDRVDVHCTHYRHATDNYGEAWITVDKQKVDGGGYFHWHGISPTRDMLIRQAPALFDSHPEYAKANSEDPDVWLMQHKGAFETYHIIGSLKVYLSTPYSECYGATNPIVRAFSLVDRRLGRRRFEAIVLDRQEYPLVARFYDLRRELFAKNV